MKPIHPMSITAKKEAIFLSELRGDFEPTPDRSCSLCLGQGYTTSHRGEYSIATPCSCLPHCIRCGETGFLRITTDGVEKAGRCRCRKLHDRIGLFNQAKIPARYGVNSFSNFDFSCISSPSTSLIQSWVKYFSPQQSNGFIFTGGVGQGKTHLLVSTCKSLIFSHGISVRFVEFSRLLMQLKGLFSERKPIEPLLRELIDVDLLAIDELGKGRSSDWEISVIDDLISRRYNAEKLLIGTTNYPWKTTTGRAPALLASEEFTQSLADRVGQRAFSRLREMAAPIDLQAVDYRGKESALEKMSKPKLRK